MTDWLPFALELAETEGWDPGSARETSQRLGLFVRRHRTFVRRLLRRLGVQPGDTADAAQEVFLTLVRRLGSIHSGSESAFLVQTTRRVASTWRRSRRRRREVGWEDIEPADPLEDLEPLVEQALDFERARARMKPLVEQLPPELREVVMRHDLGQSSMAEIAAELGLPCGTVASRLRRARRVLQQWVRGEAGLRGDPPGSRASLGVSSYREGLGTARGNGTPAGERDSSNRKA